MTDDNATAERIERNTEAFWDLAAPHMSGAVAEGTMMGSPCLRADGEFVAMIHRHTGDLIVKLPKDRVLEEVDAGSGATFAPNGRVFKEWLQVTSDDESVWVRLLADGVAFGTRG